MINGPLHNRKITNFALTNKVHALSVTYTPRDVTITPMPASLSCIPIYPLFGLDDIKRVMRTPFLM